MNWKSAVLSVTFLAAVLALWQYLPSVASLQKTTIFNTFFISDPVLIYQSLYSITLGSVQSSNFGSTTYIHGFLWPFLLHTVYASIGGVAIGVTSGYLIGVILSEVKILDEAFRPYVLFLNNIPKILVIPLVMIIFGFGEVSEMLCSAMVVFFVIFFNAYQGGRLVDPAILSFCRVLGASRLAVLRNVRVYNSLLWTIAQLPNAMAFGLLAALTAEVLGTGTGIGYLITIDLADFNTAQLFALILVTAVYGVGILVITRFAILRLVKWNKEIQ
jgi:NitT/TauT family transport system permease protein